MEEDFDLRPYLAAVLNKWLWIIGVTMIGGIAAFIISQFIPKSYEATTYVTISKPEEITLDSLTEQNVDPRLSSSSDINPLIEDYPMLATSDEILESLLETPIVANLNINTIADLRDLLTANISQGNALIQFVVRHNNARSAAGIANAWAEQFVIWATNVSNENAAFQVAIFEDQLAQAEELLVATEDDLITFESTNRRMIISNTLASLNNTHSQYLEAQQAIQFLQQDTENLRAQISTFADSDPITYADQLAALSLQLKAFNASELPIPLEINSSEDIFDPLDRRVLISQLDALVLALDMRASQLEAALVSLEPQILMLQQQKQAVESERNRLVRQNSAAAERYTALLRKVEEERITAQNITSYITQVSQASVPTTAVSPRPLINAVVAALLCFTLATVWVLVLNWWQDGSVTTSTANEAPQTEASAAAS